jgi:hypothetical protein
VIDDLLDTTKTNVLIVGPDTITSFGGGNITVADSTLKYITPHQLSNKIDSIATGIIGKKTFGIRLPSAGSVENRISGAVEGVDYPEGWILAPGDNLIDIKIEHGTGQRVSNVNVFTINGDNEQLLRPFAGAYSGYKTTNTNNLLVNSLATTPTAIKIYISFEE